MNIPTPGPHGRRRTDVMELLARARPGALDPGPAEGEPAQEVIACLLAMEGAPSGGMAGPVPGHRTRRAAHRHWGARRAAFTGAGLAAAASAAVVAVAAVTGGAAQAPPPVPAVLTAAVLHQVAGASRAALTRSGRAQITYRDTRGGVLQVTGSDDITFSGANWNDVVRQSFPATRGVPASTQFAINRIVGGHAYYYIKATANRMRWYRDTSLSGHPSVTIPDPRKILGLLEPSARFEVSGHRADGRVMLTGLRATRPGHLPGLGWLPGAGAGERVTSLVLWVDRHQVVHRMDVALGGAVHLWLPGPRAGGGTQKKLALIKKRLAHGDPATVQASIEKAYAALVKSGQLTERTQQETAAVSVVFSRIGRPQPITAPPHAAPTHARG